MDDRLQSYNAAKTRLNELGEAKSEDRDKGLVESRRIRYDVYEPQISRLEHERDEALNRVEQEYKKHEQDFDQKIERCALVVSSVDVLFNMMGVYRESSDFRPEMGLYKYSDRDEDGNWLSDKRKVYIDPVEVVHQDKYSFVAAYIVPNSKPRNKFSLVLAGVSLFPDFKVEGGIRSWLTNLHSDSRRHWEVIIREVPAVDELLVWWKKYGVPADVRACLDGHKRFEVLYEEAVDLYNNREWRLAYLAYRKRYYEDQVSRGRDSDEYRSILEEIMIERTARRNLPLLLGRVVQPEARAKLTRLLQVA